MDTKKQATPILDAVRRLHAEQDKLQGVDPYNTGRHPALLLHGPTAEQRLTAELMLLASPEKLKL